MMEKLRRRVGDYFLNRKRKSLRRNSVPHALEAAKSALILCDLDDRNEFEAGESLLKHLLGNWSRRRSSWFHGEEGAGRKPNRR